ncbi:hypothetical protein C7M84_018301 [Penaeus vannamei]|uniref:Uncharacterized protein n=1 Tax=Penaeus vannamei TaxID=6689 RepID=A0A3R7NQ60_PENVA|nr:hypothetical protein C7M84_018301 [Penaeus vannamei]
MFTPLLLIATSRVASCSTWAAIRPLLRITVQARSFPISLGNPDRPAPVFPDAPRRASGAEAVEASPPTAGVNSGSQVPGLRSRRAVSSADSPAGDVTPAQRAATAPASTCERPWQANRRSYDSQSASSSVSRNVRCARRTPEPLPISMGGLAESITAKERETAALETVRRNVVGGGGAAPPARPVVAASLGNESRPGVSTCYLAARVKLLPRRPPRDRSLPPPLPRLSGPPRAPPGQDTLSHTSSCGRNPCPLPSIPLSPPSSTSAPPLSLLLHPPPTSLHPNPSTSYPPSLHLHALPSLIPPPATSYPHPPFQPTTLPSPLAHLPPHPPPNPYPSSTSTLPPYPSHPSSLLLLHLHPSMPTSSSATSYPLPPSLPRCY